MIVWMLKCSKTFCRVNALPRALLMPGISFSTVLAEQALLTGVSFSSFYWWPGADWCFAFLIDLQQCYRGGLGMGLCWHCRRWIGQDGDACSIGTADCPPEAPKTTLHCPRSLAPHVLDHYKSDTKCAWRPWCPSPHVISQLENARPRNEQ